MKIKLFVVLSFLLCPVMVFAQDKKDELIKLDLAFAFASMNSVRDLDLIVKENFDINAKYPKYNNSSILHIAAENNAIDVVSYVINNGGIVDIEDDNQFTPFYVAILKKHFKLASLLLAKGANINHYGLFHRTPLFASTIYPEIETIEFLLQNGADMYTVQHDTGTALQVYLQNIGNNEAGRETSYDSRILELYKKHGYDVNKKDDLGYNLVHIMAMQNLEDPWRVFEKDIKTYNEPIPEGYTPLFMSVITQNFVSTRIILEHGVDVNSIDKNGATAIFYAVANKNRELFDILVKYKVDLTKRDKMNKTVYDYADEDFLKLLKKI